MADFILEEGIDYKQRGFFKGKESDNAIHIASAITKLNARRAPMVKEEPKPYTIHGHVDYSPMYSGPWHTFTFNRQNAANLPVHESTHTLWKLDIVEDRKHHEFFKHLAMYFEMMCGHLNASTNLYVGPVQIVLRGNVSVPTCRQLVEHGLKPDELECDIAPIVSNAGWKTFLSSHPAFFSDLKILRVSLSADPDIKEAERALHVIFLNHLFTPLLKKVYIEDPRLESIKFHRAGVEILIPHKLKSS